MKSFIGAALLVLSFSVTSFAAKNALLLDFCKKAQSWEEGYDVRTFHVHLTGPTALLKIDLDCIAFRKDGVTKPELTSDMHIINGRYAHKLVNGTLLESEEKVTPEETLKTSTGTSSKVYSFGVVKGNFSGEFVLETEKSSDSGDHVGIYAEDIIPENQLGGLAESGKQYSRAKIQDYFTVVVLNDAKPGTSPLDTGTVIVRRDVYMFSATKNAPIFESNVLSGLLHRRGDGGEGGGLIVKTFEILKKKGIQPSKATPAERLKAQREAEVELDKLGYQGKENYNRAHASGMAIKYSDSTRNQLQVLSREDDGEFIVNHVAYVGPAMYGSPATYFALYKIPTNNPESWKTGVNTKFFEMLDSLAPWNRNGLDLGQVTAADRPKIEKLVQKAKSALAKGQF